MVSAVGACGKFSLEARDFGLEVIRSTLFCSCTPLLLLLLLPLLPGLLLLPL